MKTINFALMASLILMSCSNKDYTDSSTTLSSSAPDAVRDSLQMLVAQQDSAIALFNEINEAMEQIKSVEGIITASGTTGDITNQRQQMRDNMAAIQASIARNRERLSTLEQRIGKSNSNNSQLKRAIQSLRNQILLQERTITSLRDELAAANIYIEELTQTNDSLSTSITVVEQKAEEVQQQNVDLKNRLNTAYYVIGSKKELKDHNIIETGFLRKAKISPADYQIDYFTCIDIRTFKSIDLHSKKAEIMSPQPVDSYTITTDANGMKTLKVTNPDKFWSTTNYLVIKID